MNLRKTPGPIKEHFSLQESRFFHMGTIRQETISVLLSNFYYITRQDKKW